MLIIATWLLLISQLSLALSLAPFEVVSAFSTTGLSLGVTGTLDTFGRLLIIVTMFWGRLGAITIMLYVAAVLESLRDFTPIEIQLMVDDASWTLKAMLCVVSNGPTFGGGMRIAPMARPDDGLHDVCVVSEASRWDLIKTLPRVYRGTHTTHPKVRLVQGRRIRIETPRPVPLLVDGEFVGRTPAELTVVPGAIDVIVSAETRRPA